MRQLDRKLIRDLWRMKSQVIAIALVFGCGIAMFVMSMTAQSSLRLSQQNYYAAYRFGQIFTQLKRAPNSLARQIANIPGVATVQTRIAVDVTLDVPGMNEPAAGRLISLPDHGRSLLNDVHLRRGRYPETSANNETLVSEPFADAHGLQPGDHVSAVMNGRLQKLQIVGIALSPEFIFTLKPGELLPDDRRFGIFWMMYSPLAAAWNLEGAFNSVSLSMMRGASEKEILRRLDLLTEPYGGIGAVGLNDQLSHRFLSEEMEQLAVMGTLAPSIFLAVAAFLLNMVASRLVSVQREQIAALKAFGYTHQEVASHYLKAVLLIAGSGTLLGSLVGIRLGQGLTAMYATFYRFPQFYFRMDPMILLMGATLGILAGIVGAWASVLHVARLPAAEAMRSEPPGNFRPTFVERMGLENWMPLTARMVVRQLERRPIKAVLSVIGIAMAVAVLIVGNFGLDAIMHMIDVQFYRAQHDDVTVTFNEPTSHRAIHALRHYPGVLRCEPLRTAPVRLIHGRNQRLTTIVGLPQDRQLRILLDDDLTKQDLPPDGLVLNTKLAEMLDVGLGDLVRVEILEGQRAVTDAPVVQLISEFTGLNAYMDRRALQRLLRESPTANAALLQVDSYETERLHRELKFTPRVAGVALRQAALQSFHDTIAENLLRMKTYNITFAAIIAFGVVYNTARISLSERYRELATLRVMGFTRWEISSLLLGELAVLTIAALPLGAWVGYALATAMAEGMQTEMYRIPKVVSRSSFAMAIVVTLLASIISGLIVRRNLDRIDLVEALKIRE